MSMNSFICNGYIAKVTHMVRGLVSSVEEYKKSSGEWVKTFITIAIKYNYKNESGEYKTDFIQVERLHKTDSNDIADYLNVGSYIVINGSIRANNFVNKNGEKQYNQIIYADSIDLVYSKKAEDDAKAEAEAVAEIFDETPPAKPVKETPTPAKRGKKIA